MRYEDVYEMKKHTREECLALIESGDTIAVSGVATEPTDFLGHFTEIVPRLHDVTVVKSKDNEYAYLRDPATRGHVETIGHFYAKNMREGHELGIASYIPSDLHNYMAERVAYKPNKTYKKLYAAVEKHVRTVKFEEQSQGEILKWVSRRFKAAGHTIDVPTAEHLLFTCGSLMNGLIPEIAKISAYARGERITRADIDAVAAPILCGGDVLGLVLFISAEDRLPGEGEYKLAQAVAGFLGKHMEA